ncbi:hypothetical protein CRM81_03960 [Yersinia kristensenii]|nr:hypothetical protein CRM81_03960 [Yersinia kristensenii]SUP70413.1 Uncharacterised protein [Yersinia kristensenii]SUQ39300.1 Uncharacterised protein [Yersinia kristensenii]
MNPRFDAFLRINTNNVWRSHSERNAAYMTFIANMKCKYVKHNNLDENTIGGAYISDHDDFTRFILSEVNKRSNSIYRDK